jgi:hypothetical protein
MEEPEATKLVSSGATGVASAPGSMELGPEEKGAGPVALQAARKTTQELIRTDQILPILPSPSPTKPTVSAGRQVRNKTHQL